MLLPQLFSLSHAGFLEFNDIFQATVKDGVDTVAVIGGEDRQAIVLLGIKIPIKKAC